VENKERRNLQLNDKNFMDFIERLERYLAANKVFTKNPERYAEVLTAANIAKELFQDETISIENDELQIGSLVLCVQGYDLTIRGEREIKLFTELISKADNFEVVPIGGDKIELAIMFDDAMTVVIES
jgi:hypothetical protein